MNLRRIAYWVFMVIGLWCFWYFANLMYFLYTTDAGKKSEPCYYCGQDPAEEDYHNVDVLFEGREEGEF